MRVDEYGKPVVLKNSDGDHTTPSVVMIENADNESYNKEDLRSLLFELIHKLVELAVSHGFEGNLWHNYMTILLANSENAYSTSCEIVGAVEGSINEVALHDFAIFKELFDYDLKILEGSLSVKVTGMIENYHQAGSHGKVYNKRIRDRICELGKKLEQAEDAEKLTAKREYDAKKGIVVEEEPADTNCLSGIPSRPYCKGRNYDPNRYASTEE